MSLKNAKKLEEMRQRTAEKREAMKHTQYDATIENNFFPVVEAEIYRQIVEDGTHGAQKR